MSLVVSFYVYDISDLYKLTWLNNINVTPEDLMLNIHAGFDETSALLKNKFGDCKLVALDFYDPSKHTEISIRRARKAYHPYPNTKSTSTTNIPLSNNSADVIFAILSSHEIRDPEELAGFFRELKRVLKTKGQIVVAEHLRDPANLLAYNLGAFHFHSRHTWLKAFAASGLKVTSEKRITPFITAFILAHDSDPS